MEGGGGEEGRGRWGRGTPALQARKTRTHPNKQTTHQSTQKELQDLLRRLLTRRPALRLGARAGGADDVKRHPWFAGFDWRAFEAREMAAPHVPRVAHAGDAGNFRPQVDAAAAGGAYRSQPYSTTGDFSSF